MKSKTLKLTESDLGIIAQWWYYYHENHQEYQYVLDLMKITASKIEAKREINIIKT